MRIKCSTVMRGRLVFVVNPGTVDQVGTEDLQGSYAC